MDREAINNRGAAVSAVLGKVRQALETKPHFTGQINIEMHLKDGILKDVYVTERAKVNVK